MDVSKAIKHIKVPGKDRKSPQSSPPDCEICGDTGFFPTENISVKYCVCRKKKIFQRKVSKIPKTFRENKLPENLNAHFYSDVSEKFIPLSYDLLSEGSYENNYFLFGKLGAYKTTFLWKQFEVFTKNDKMLTYADTAIEMVMKYQEQKYKDVVHYDFEQEGIHVFIDDIDKLSVTEDRSMQMFDIIDQIYRNCAGLTLTSNLGLNDLERGSILGERTTAITRRIMDICTVVRFD